MRTILITVAAAAFVVTLATSMGCAGRSQAAAGPELAAGEVFISIDQMKEAGITVAPAAEQEVGGELTLPGRVTFDDQRVTHVFSPVTGRLVRMIVALGQHVAKGDPLAIIESPDVGAALSDLAKAKADLEAAEHDYKRMKELYELHAGAQRDYEAAESRYRQSKAELERAQRKAHLLHADGADQVTQEYTLRSPIDGEVIARNANPGTEVQGQYSGGAAVELFTIGANDRVWVLADVYEADVPRVKGGAPVTVRVVSFPDRAIEGRVDWISGALDPASRTTKVRCVLSNRDGALKPEMYATVSLKVAGRRTLAVPRGALFRMGDTLVVFVEKERTEKTATFVLRPVETNDEGSAGPVAILRGLASGERVVTSGAVLVAGKLSQ